MAIIKCKMCGGDLLLSAGSSVCECEYCGTKQTVPSTDNEKKLTLFGRAGQLLRACEFDKAAGVFEMIVVDFPEEAEAYWGLVLCKYGIEYVDDPEAGKKIPTCHRSSFESVLDDPNYEQACEKSDAVARNLYRDEAREIEELRKGIIEVSGNEEPYDVFISYKETDENGERTLDSVIAQDIYRELKREGFRTFFSRVSLEGKLGIEYEPYIFAAINSARVMLVVGTCRENFNSIWVRNEWSRFLARIAAGERKTLIPVFRDMDAYDMPKEFTKLAAQDMGKLGAMQDLVHGVEKCLARRSRSVESTKAKENLQAARLVLSGQEALEERDWARAKDSFEQAIKADSELAEAYVGLFCAENKNTTLEKTLEQRALASEQRARQVRRALPENEERRREIIEKYEIPDKLPASFIISLLDYGGHYSSTVDSWKEIGREEIQKLKNDPIIQHAQRYATGVTAARLNSAIERFERTLKEREREAKELESLSKQKEEKAYSTFLDDNEAEIARMYQDVLQEREQQQKDSLENEKKDRKKGAGLLVPITLYGAVCVLLVFVVCLALAERIAGGEISYLVGGSFSIILLLLPEALWIRRFQKRYEKLLKPSAYVTIMRVICLILLVLFTLLLFAGDPKVMIIPTLVMLSYVVILFAAARRIRKLKREEDNQ